MPSKPPIGHKGPGIGTPFRIYRPGFKPKTFHLRLDPETIERAKGLAAKQEISLNEYLSRVILRSVDQDEFIASLGDSKAA